jgi:hypothetical protein
MHAQRMDAYNFPIFQILMEIFDGIGGWFFVSFGVGRHLMRDKLGGNCKKIHPDHGGRCHSTAAMVSLPQCHHIPQASNTLRYNSMLLKLELIIVISINLTIHCGALTSVVGCVLF